jgi:protein with PEP-CTERM/exosortase system signal
MKKFITLLSCLACAVAARADFTSYTLASQSDPLTYDPVVTHTFDTLSINMTGNTPSGDENIVTNQAEEDGASIVLDFGSTHSIIGDSVQLAWYYPDGSTVYEYFPSIIVPGVVFAGSGAGDFTITGDTVTIVNDTSGWSEGAFNGFVITDLSQQGAGQGNPTQPTSGVPDTASTLLLAGAAVAGLAIFRRKAAAA